MGNLTKRLTSTFYSVPGAFGFRPDEVDRALTVGAVARWEHPSIVVRWPDGQDTFYAVPPGSRTRAVKWVNKFNERARKSRPSDSQGG